MEHSQTSLIDINEVIRNKNPKLYRRLPKFIIHYLKRIIRQDELNDFIKKNNQYTGIEFLRKSFEYFNVKAEVEGEENFPDSSRIILAANHPAGSFDGLYIINTCFSKYGMAKALVNDLLLNVKNLNEFFMGVNKYGTTPRDYLTEINTIFESNAPVIFFPAGYVSRRNKGEIRDLIWQKSVVRQAIKHKRDIIPVYISGNLSNKYYYFANIRKALGIKSNLEMFLLPQELTKQRNAVYKIKIGKPISYKELNSKFKEYDWAQKIKIHVYKLSGNINTEFKY
ncbi:MAG: glycerol acyltransferase [Chlorobi bacterium]|nr:glycerol acyltransferase [Chlorobiota bacterium]